MSDEKDYEQVWKECWEEICTNEDGSLNLDQIKRELYDYWFMLENVPVVYEHITGGLLSKTNYYASSVIEAADNYQQRLWKEYEEEFREELEDEFKSRYQDL